MANDIEEDRRIESNSPVFASNHVAVLLRYDVSDHKAVTVLYRTARKKLG